MICNQDEVERSDTDPQKSEVFDHEALKARLDKTSREVMRKK
jgi:hypothetical protein